MNDEKNMENKDQIRDLGLEVTKSSKGNIYTLTIIGQVEGHQVAPETVKTTKYEHILPLLAGIEESDDVDGLLLLLNTVGGDIEAGLAIAEMIAGMKKPTVFKRRSRPSTSSLSSIPANSGRICSYFVVFTVSGAT